MTDYTKSLIVVTADDKSVSIDGRKLVAMTAAPSDVRVMRWNPAVKDWPGFVENQHGEGRAFKEFERIAPYVGLWVTAAAIDDEQQAAIKAHADAEATRVAAEEAARLAEFKAQVAAQKKLVDAAKPMNDALKQLAASDFKVIKAVEELLSKSGEIDAETVAEREALRVIVRKAQEQA